MNVYLLKQLDFYKIGKANNVQRRIRQLQTSTPQNIEYIGSIKSKDAIKLEGEIHKYLHNYRVNGEWFKLDNDVLSHVIGTYNFVKDDDVKHKSKRIVLSKETASSDSECFNFSKLDYTDFVTMMKRHAKTFDRYTTVNRDYIGDMEWGEYIGDLIGMYGEKIAFNILAMKESIDSQDIIRYCYDLDPLDENDINYILSERSKIMDYSFIDKCHKFCNYIIGRIGNICEYSYNSIDYVSQKASNEGIYSVFDTVLIFRDILIRLCTNYNNGTFDKVIYKKVINCAFSERAGNEIFSLICDYKKNFDCKQYCLKKIKTVLKENKLPISTNNLKS